VRGRIFNVGLVEQQIRRAQALVMAGYAVAIEQRAVWRSRRGSGPRTLLSCLKVACSSDYDCNAERQKYQAGSGHMAPFW
jgi:hypothetical protein